MATRILIAEADRQLAQGLAQLLGSQGYDVRVAHGPADAHGHVSQWAPEALIIDHHLPPHGGAQLVAMLRSVRPHDPLPVLYLVHPQRVGSDLRKIYPTLDDFVLKPAHAASVVERLNIMLMRVSNLATVMMQLGRYHRSREGQRPAQRTRMVVMFTDVRSFTQMSETRDPETVAGALNDLFAHLADCVIRNGGKIDKFLGDGMLAIFLPEEGGVLPELRAVRASGQIMRSVVESEVTSLIAGADLRLGIGLNAGTAVMGPMGPPYAQEVTVIGDTVNTAARLCGQAEPGEIIVSQGIYDKVHSQVRLRGERTVNLKGKRDAQRVFAIEV